MKKQALVLLFAFFLILGTGMFAYFKRIYTSVVVHTPTVMLPFINKTTPTPTPDPTAPYSILLLGYGGGGHDGGFLTDTMIIAYIIPKKELVYLIPIPRDVWVPLPIEGDVLIPYKINAAYAIGRDDRRFSKKPDVFKGTAGGGTLAKYAAGLVFGKQVDYFAAISFEGFQKSIDILDGVDVAVPHTFDDFLYPIEEEKENNCGKSDEDIQAVTATLSGTLLEKEFPCRYEQIHFDKGPEHMDGTRALKFVRSRKSEQYGGDFNRSLRQQALLKAVKEKVISLNFISKIFPFISTLTQDMQTDVTASVFTQKLNIHPNITSFVIKTVTISDLFVEGRSSDGQFILIPKTGENNWDEIHSFISSSIEK